MLIRGRDVAMIFADIRLPGVMDGIDLAREVRMRWPFLPVILTSGHPRDDQFVFITGYGDHGLSAYRNRPTLRKPFQIDTLKRALQERVRTG